MTAHSGARSSAASTGEEDRDKSYVCAAPSVLAGHPGCYTRLSLPARSHTGETSGCSPPGMEHYHLQVAYAIPSLS